MKLTNELQQTINQMVEQTLAIPEIQIIEEKMGKERVRVTKMTEDDLFINTKTIFDNYLVIQSHNDADYLPKGLIATGGNKFSTANVNKMPLGVYSIDLENGVLVRNTGDLRFTKKDQLNKKSFWFVFDEESRVYREFTMGETKQKSKWQYLAEERMEAFDQIKIDLLFSQVELYDYLTKFLERPLLTGDSKDELAHYFNQYDEFYENAQWFAKIHLIFGSATIEEYQKLTAELDKVMKARDLHQQIALAPFKALSYNDLQNELHFFANQLVAAREENIDTPIVIIKNAMDQQGKLIDKELLRKQIRLMKGLFVSGKGLYPSLLEIQRRTMVYEHFSSIEKENEQIAFLKQVVANN